MDHVRHARFENRAGLERFPSVRAVIGQPRRGSLPGITRVAVRAEFAQATVQAAHATLHQASGRGAVWLAYLTGGQVVAGSNPAAPTPNPLGSKHLQICSRVSLPLPYGPSPYSCGCDFCCSLSSRARSLPQAVLHDIQTLNRKPGAARSNRCLLELSGKWNPILAASSFVQEQQCCSRTTSESSWNTTYLIDSRPPCASHRLEMKVFGFLTSVT